MSKQNSVPQDTYFIQMEANIIVEHATNICRWKQILLRNMEQIILTLKQISFALEINFVIDGTYVAIYC